MANNKGNLSIDENEMLKAYKQLSNEGKAELIKRMKALLNKQEREKHEQNHI
jgi:cytoskeletal protein RodZ